MTKKGEFKMTKKKASRHHNVPPYSFVSCFFTLLYTAKPE